MQHPMQMQMQMQMQTVVRCFGPTQRSTRTGGVKGRMAKLNPRTSDAEAARSMNIRLVSTVMNTSDRKDESVALPNHWLLADTAVPQCDLP